MFRSGLILEGKDLGGREHDNKYKLLYCDPLEFPRNKLVLFDTPLGKSPLSHNLSHHCHPLCHSLFSDSHLNCTLSCLVLLGSLLGIG